MEFTGYYKAYKTAKFDDEKGLVYVEVEELLASTEDIDDQRMYEQMSRSLIGVDEKANILQLMEIPDGAPAKEIEKAKSIGMSITEDGKYMIMKSDIGKIEDGELYLHDESTFLTGSEWAKISTDKSDELQLATTIYKKI